MSAFIIAEVGVNHNGELDRALELVEVAAQIGANAVKFQTFKSEQLAASSAKKADYQVKQTGSGDQLEMLAALELSESDHRTIVAHCSHHSVEFMSTPFDVESAELLVSLGVSRLKIGSGDLDFVPLLRKFAALQRPVILSTGMANLEEVRASKRVLEDEWERLGVMADRADRLTILHCTSNYPTLPEDVNLRAMQTMMHELNCPVGYSDHTEDIFVAVGAVALGACVIEKHITLDRNLPGPDHAASLEPDAFAEMVRQIRAIENALGDGFKRPRDSEISVRDVVRRSIRASRDLPVGTILSETDLVMLRPADGLSPIYLDEVIGKTLSKDLLRHTSLIWDDIQ